jgi:hypothetical protein
MCHKKVALVASRSLRGSYEYTHKMIGFVIEAFWVGKTKTRAGEEKNSVSFSSFTSFYLSSYLILSGMVRTKYVYIPSPSPIPSKVTLNNF